MIATAIVLLALGLPFVALGVHLGRASTAEKAKKKARKAGAGAGPSPTSFIVGGGLLTLIGAALLAAKLAG